MSKATEKQWRVQVRAEYGKPWKNKGLFETRSRAREEAWWFRDGFIDCVGFGKTRVIPYVKAKKAVK